MQHYVTDFRKFLVISCQPKTGDVTEKFKCNLYEHILNEMKSFLTVEETNISALRIPFIFIYSQNLLYIVFCFKLYDSEWEKFLISTLEKKATEFEIKPDIINWLVTRKKDDPTRRDLRSAHGVYKQLTLELDVKKLTVFSQFFTESDLAKNVTKEPRSSKQAFRIPLSSESIFQAETKQFEHEPVSVEALQRVEKKNLDVSVKTKRKRVFTRIINIILTKFL